MGKVLKTVRMFVMVGGREEVVVARILGDVRFADRSRCRAVAVRTANGLDWEVGVRIVSRKFGWGAGSDCAVRELVRVASVGTWFAI